MANFQETATSGLIDSFSLLGTQDCPERIRNFKVLVCNELARINNAYFSLSDRIVNRPDPLVIFNQVEIRTKLLDELQSKSFPSLKRQVIALSNAVISRQSNSVTELQLVLKVLSKLDDTLGKIKFAVACINPGLDSQEVRHDQDFKKAKHAICCRLGLIVNVATGHVCDFLQASHRFIISSTRVVTVDHAPRMTEVHATAGICSLSIDKALEFMNMSELSFIQDGWKSHINLMDDFLETITTFANRPEDHSKNQSHPQPVNEDVNTRSNVAPTSNQPTTTTPLIALIKMTRLFYVKLLKISAEEKNFSMVTNLTSRELEIYIETATMVSESIEKLVLALCGDIGEDQIENTLAVYDSIVQLQSAPKNIMFMTDHTFLPVFHQINQPHHKMYIKAWFYHWNRLNNLATDNFQNAFRFNPT